MLSGCNDENTNLNDDEKPILSGIVSIDDQDKIEIVTWNVERFPKSTLTVDYFAELLKELGADIYLLQEILSSDNLADVVADLAEYDYFLLSNYTGLNLAIVYKNTTVNLKSTTELFENNDHYFAGRPPLLVKIEWAQNSIIKEYYLINVHFKCCGDNAIDVGNENDEEYRRVKANELLYNYITDELEDKNVIVAGDWNDAIEEPVETNVFQIFIDDPNNFEFADMNIAVGEESDWSWQGWSSSYPAIHFDHILINQNMFDEFQNNSTVSTIKIDEYFENGSDDYDDYLSDHRPVYFQFGP